MKVGFLGLGGMGTAMATRLVQAGLEVTVWNRSAAACEPLVALGAARAEEVGELFGLDVVISMLADDQAIRGVLLAMGVLLDAQELIPALVEEVLQFDTDRLLDYLGAAAIGLTSASEETFHPRPFGQLRAFFEEADGSDAQALAPYLQSQYREFFQLSPKAQKKTRRLTGPYAWGWWAMEVSALGVLYGWDDGVLRASPHYLGDLVDYARARGDA
ncbi:TPA: DUF1911 domain-containing protein [Pseudomonas aeruginosa]|nr:DUF1911 domain-containing protein [Pseudomonas aeruginosa]